MGILKQYVLSSPECHEVFALWESAGGRVSDVDDSGAVGVGRSDPPFRAATVSLLAAILKSLIPSKKKNTARENYEVTFVGLGAHYVGIYCNAVIVKVLDDNRAVVDDPGRSRDAMALSNYDS